MTNVITIIALLLLACGWWVNSLWKRYIAKGDAARQRKMKTLSYVLVVLVFLSVLVGLIVFVPVSKPDPLGPLIFYAIFVGVILYSIPRPNAFGALSVLALACVLDYFRPQILRRIEHHAAGSGLPVLVAYDLAEVILWGTVGYLVLRSMKETIFDKRG